MVRIVQSSPKHHFNEYPRRTYIAAQRNTTVVLISRILVHSIVFVLAATAFYLYYCYFYWDIEHVQTFYNVTNDNKAQDNTLPPYNNYNPNPDWCPKAKCQNSPMCSPCKRKFLIIIATGRSGSTSLLDMLNLLPGVRIAGENNGHLIYGLREMKNLQDTPEFRFDSEQEVTGAWKHFPIPKQSLACPIQHMFEAINPPKPSIFHGENGTVGNENDTIIGFKTVRFHSNDFLLGQDDLIEAVDYMMETFPCARFVINIRGNVESQIQSWKAAFGANVDGNEIRLYNERLGRAAALMGQDRARLIDMSEWSRKDNSGLMVLNDLIEWLGFENCAFSSLIHSNKNGYRMDSSEISLGEDCHLPKRNSMQLL
jgi:hypothetical protein